MPHLGGVGFKLLALTNDAEWELAGSEIVVGHVHILVTQGFDR